MQVHSPEPHTDHQDGKHGCKGEGIRRLGELSLEETGGNVPSPGGDADSSGQAQTNHREVDGEEEDGEHRHATKRQGHGRLREARKQSCGRGAHNGICIYCIATEEEGARASVKPGVGET